MIKNHADVLISKPLPYGDYGYEIYFANQLDFNSLVFIDGQINILDKLNSENQKILLIKYKIMNIQLMRIQQKKYLV